MGKRYGVIVASLGILGYALGAASASAMSVNGDLSDWGVTVVDTPAVGGCSNTTSTNAAICHNTNYGVLPAIGSGLLGGAKLLGYTAQDGNDTSNNYGNAPGLLAPYYGGQNYDAEFLGVAQQGHRLYIAISTGQRPDNGFNEFEPGDLRIKLFGGPSAPANGNYGVELGGGAGHTGGPDKAAITNADINNTAGTTYTLDSHGYVATGGANNSVAKIGQINKGTSATIYAVTDYHDPMFKTGVYSNTNATQIKDTGTTSTDTGLDVSQIYGTQDTYGTLSGAQRQHNIIELEIDLDTLISSTPDDWAAYSMDFAWGPSCGNDLVVTNVQLTKGDIPNPEPAALSLLFFGIGAVARLRRRQAA